MWFWRKVFGSCGGLSYVIDSDKSYACRNIEINAITSGPVREGMVTREGPYPFIWEKKTQVWEIKIKDSAGTKLFLHSAAIPLAILEKSKI